MQATYILTITLISHLILSLFFKLLDTYCLEIIGFEGNSEIPAIWRIHNPLAFIVKDINRRQNNLRFLLIMK